MAERTDPRNRSEAEIAGYRSALDLIHQGAQHMSFTPGVVLQPHRDLYQLAAEPGGRFKPTDNQIEGRHPDGTVTVIFQAVPFAETGEAMEELHRRTQEAWAAGRHHRLLIVGGDQHLAPGQQHHGAERQAHRAPHVAAGPRARPPGRSRP